MSEMINRVARAIFICDAADGQCSYEDIARAVIEAMREPTIEMLQAGHTYVGTRYKWQTMIDEALCLTQTAPKESLREEVGERELAEVDALLSCHAYKIDSNDPSTWPTGSVLKKAMDRHAARIARESRGENDEPLAGA